MQLLADAVDTYRMEDVARWWEWEAAAEVDGLHGARRWLGGHVLDWDDAPSPRSCA